MSGYFGMAEAEAAIDVDRQVVVLGEDVAGLEGTLVHVERVLAHGLERLVEPGLVEHADVELLEPLGAHAVVARGGGVRLDENEKVLVSLGAANRDREHWERPDTFDITRRTTGHLAFGAGIHGCVGQMMARLELEMLLGALLERVAAIEYAGTPVWLSHNTLRTLERLPLRFTLN